MSRSRPSKRRFDAAVVRKKKNTGPGGMACRGWPAGCMLGDGARDSASFDPQHAGRPSVTSYAMSNVNNLKALFRMMVAAL